jgi:hypothetical protein
MLEVVAALAEVCDYTDRPDEAAKWRAELATLRTLPAALDKAFYHGDLNDYTNLGLLVPAGIAPKSGSKAGRVFYCPDADRFLVGPSRRCHQRTGQIHLRRRCDARRQHQHRRLRPHRRERRIVGIGLRVCERRLQSGWEDQR